MLVIICPKCNLRQKRGKAADLVGGVNIPEVLMTAVIDVKCECIFLPDIFQSSCLSTPEKRFFNGEQ